MDPSNQPVYTKKGRIPSRCFLLVKTVIMLLKCPEVPNKAPKILSQQDFFVLHFLQQSISDLLSLGYKNKI